VHNVYLDTDAVAATDTSDITGIYLGRQAETMVIPEGLVWAAKYY
jgi:hypothetical protein